MTEQVMVVGAGQMGAGIAQVAAVAGYEVTLVDVSEAQLERARAGIRRSLDKLVEKGRVERDAAEESIARIATHGELDGTGAVGLVVEAAPEDEHLKLDLFRRLDAAVDSAAVLASNTSSIPITRLAAATGRPERVIGMHFMNPVPLMPLVELVRGLETSEETAAHVRAAAERMGKTVAEARDLPGFISNRVLLPMINEAVYCLMEGVGDRESIDTVMRLGMSHPLGPLQLADLIGLDTCLSIMEVLHAGLGDDKYRPCPLLRTYVEAGRLGRKSGRGFYDYA